MGTDKKFPRFTHEEIEHCKRLLKEHGFKQKEVQNCIVEVQTDQEKRDGESEKHFYCKTYLGSLKGN